jgi:hypothetical protein
MKFLHSRLETEDGDAILVKLSGTEANVQVMSDSDFRNYRSHGKYSYFGGHYRRSPAIIRPPSGGWWNIVIDLGGAGGRLEAAVSVLH